MKRLLTFGLAFVLVAGQGLMTVVNADNYRGYRGHHHPYYYGPWRILKKLNSKIKTNKAHIADNFSATTDNRSALMAQEARISALESGDGGNEVAIDCTSDSTALLNTQLQPKTTYILTGMCDGQIVVGAGLGTIRIEGDAIGVKDDGIILPPGEIDDGSVFTAIYGWNGVHLVLSNLTISAANYNGESDLYIEAIGSYRAAHVELIDVDVVGGDGGLGAYNTGTFSVSGNSSITGFRGYGAIANRAAVIRFFDEIDITGGSNQEGSYSEALAAYHGGVIAATDTTNIAPATGPNINNNNSAAVSAVRNGTITLVGGTLIGTLWSGESSAVDLRNITQLNGNTEPYRNSVMRIRNSNIAGAHGDLINTGDFSTLRIDSTVVNNLSRTASIDTYRYGVIDVRGSSDLNGRDINCADRRELRLVPDINAGDFSC